MPLPPAPPLPPEPTDPERRAYWWSAGAVCTLGFIAVAGTSAASGTHWLSTTWFGYTWPSLKGNGPEALTQTLVYGAIAVAFVPLVRRFLRVEFARVHHRIEHLHQTVAAHHEEGKAERAQLHEHLAHLGRHMKAEPYAPKSPEEQTP